MSTIPVTEVVVEFVHDRSTKNTEQFQEVVPAGANEVIGTLYVKKAMLIQLGNPQTLRVTLEDRDVKDRIGERVVSLFECELRNEETMIRDARRRDEIPPATTIATVIDSLAQGLGLQDDWTADDWLNLVETVAYYGKDQPVEPLVEWYR